MKKNQKGISNVAAIVFLLLVIICGVGWVKNIIKLAECDFESPYKAEVLHAVGLVPIIGAVTGYIDIGK